MKVRQLKFKTFEAGSAADLDAEVEAWRAGRREEDLNSWQMAVSHTLTADGDTVALFALTIAYVD